MHGSTRLDASGDRGGRPRSLAFVPLLLVLLTGSTLAACSAGQATDAPSSSMPGMSASAHATMHEPADLPPSDADTAWAARPDFAQLTAETEEAYAYALYHPEVVRWMPCYCGCVAMNHGSNLDCYYKPAVAGSPTTFEEHASFCDICVETTLLAKRMTADGASLAEIRQAVDNLYGDVAPGTETAYPPA